MSQNCFVSRELGNDDRLLLNVDPNDINWCSVAKEGVSTYFFQSVLHCVIIISLTITRHLWTVVRGGSALSALL